MNINASNILIVGLGMIGSSIALACKSKGIHVKAFDIDKSVYEDALKNNVIDESVEFFENINSLEFVSTSLMILARALVVCFSLLVAIKLGHIVPPLSSLFLQSPEPLHISVALRIPSFFSNEKRTKTLLGQ